MHTLLLTLIFARPFISSVAFPFANAVYSAVLLSFLFAWCALKRPSLKGIGTLRRPLLAFILALLISAVFSIDKAASLRESYKYVSALLLFFIGSSLDRRHKDGVLKTVVLAGAAIGALAAYQYFFGFEHVARYAGQDGPLAPFAVDYLERKRVFIPFVTPNTLAGFLIMVIPLAMIPRVRSYPALFFMLPSLILTGSIGAFLSIFLSLAVWWYARGAATERKNVYLSLLLYLVVLVAVVRTVASPQHAQPLFSTAMRWDYWKATLEVIRMRPLAGVGLGNFNLPASRYAHNSYLQLWAETGTIGFIGLLWFVCAFLKTASRAARPGTPASIAPQLFLACLAFLIHNLVDFTWFLPEVSMLWWLLAGLSISGAGP